MRKIVLYLTSILMFPSCFPIAYETLISLDGNEKINTRKEIFNGEKDGVWKRSMNEKLIPVSSDKAVYFEFVLITKYGVFPPEYDRYSALMKKYKISYNNIPDSIPQFVNGEFTINKRKNKPTLKFFFKDGVLEKKIIYHKNGKTFGIINSTINKKRNIYEEISEKYDKKGVFISKVKLTVTKDEYKIF